MNYKPSQLPFRCWANVSLSALAHNARVCRALLTPQQKLMAIVKADAYGHGLEDVSKALAAEVDWFGVANAREGQRIRQAADQGAVSPTPILLLSPVAPVEIPFVVAEEFSASVSTRTEIQLYSRAAQEQQKKARLHLVIDTGMGRMGCSRDEAGELVRLIVDDPCVELEGVSTHFPSADEDASFTEQQISWFRSFVEPLPPCLTHLSNSAGLLGFQQQMPFVDVVRPGLAIYGVDPFHDKGSQLRPALEMLTEVTLLRDIPTGTSISYGRTFTSSQPMRVATLAAGYGDGYPRSVSNRGADVLIAGQRCPILGRVTMDQIVVDVSHLAEGEVKPGSQAVLIGQQGDEEISATELAGHARTIPWEILTGITSRVPRVIVAQ